jgi:Protein of unknown function
MASFESINEQLRMAAECLDRAVIEIRELPLEPAKEHIRSIGEALTNIIQIQHVIYLQRPELQPDYFDEDVPEPDPDLTRQEKELVAKLSREMIEEIDMLLLSHAQHNWRKVAMLVGLTMMDLKNRPRGIPDIFYAQRVRKLVEEGRLESQGNLQYMRFSEVRLPNRCP